MINREVLWLLNVWQWWPQLEQFISKVIWFYRPIQAHRGVKLLVHILSNQSPKILELLPMGIVGEPQLLQRGHMLVDGECVSVTHHFHVKPSKWLLSSVYQ